MADVKSSKVKYPIGFKLIFIVSLIIILSLSGITFLASLFFKADTEALIQGNNFKISELTSSKVRSDVEVTINKAFLIANTLIKSEKTYGAENENLNSLLLSKKDDIFFIGIASNKKNKSIKIEKYAENNSSLNELSTNKDKIIKILSENSKDFIDSFNMNIIFKNYSPFFEQPVIAFSTPFIKKNETQADSILIILIKNDKFQRSITSEKSRGITTSFILNSDGDILAYPDKENVLKNINMADTGIYKTMKKSTIDNSVIRYKDNKEYYLGSFQKVGIGGLTVFTIVNENIAFAAVYKIQKQNILITVIILFSAILFIFYFAKTITNPLKKLVKATAQIEEGNFDIKIESKSKDEIGLLSASFEEMGRGLAEREKMKEAFGKFVNKEIAEQAMKGEIKLGGEIKKATIFFSDIRSFTAISEKLKPEEVVEFLNQYMTRMVDCINKNHGVVDKFIGDAIMAVWGTPISHGNDAENAINAALMMRESLIDFNKDRGSAKKPIIQIGCGLNTGEVLAGQIGSQEKMEYTVIGDAVNLASRIESLNKPFRTDIIVSEDTYSQVKDIFDFTSLKKIMVKGKEEPQRIFAVLKRKDSKKGPNDINELRKMLGLSAPTLKSFKSQIKDKKYEIID